MALRRRRAQSVFHFSQTLALSLALGLAFLLFAAEPLAFRLSAIAAIFSPAQSPSATQAAQSANAAEQKRLAAQRRTRFANDEEVERDVQTRAYAAALRQACGLPRASLDWRALGPSALASADFCGALESEWPQWLAESGLTATRGATQPFFFNGALGLSQAQPLWWASAGTHGLWRGSAAGWQIVSPMETDLVSVSAVEPQTVYAVRNGWRLDTSVDGGASFVTATAQLAEPEDAERLPVAPLALHPARAKQLWTGGQALWRSLDDGAQWERVTGPVAGTASNRVSVLAVAASKSAGTQHTQTVLAGTREGWLQRFVFTGKTLEPAESDAALPRRGFVAALAFAPQDARLVYAAYATFGGAHVWQSTDGGLTWRALDGAGATALPDIPVNALAADPSVPGRLFVGTDAGVFVTDSLAAEPGWSLVWPGVWVTALQIAPGPDGQPQLYAFANDKHGAGLWAAALPEPANVSRTAAQQPPQSPCINSLKPAALVVSAAGETRTIEVEAPAQCLWATTLEASAEGWITVVGAAAGQGNGRVTLKIEINAPYAPRFSSVNIGGRTLSIAQVGSLNDCRTRPITPGEPVNGQLNVDDCLVPSGFNGGTGAASFAYADRYSFNAKAGELIAVLAQALTNQTQVSYYVFGPEGQGIPLFNSSNNSNGQVLSPLPQAGTYTLQVVGNQPQQTINYRLALQLLPAGCDSFSVTALDRNFAAEGGTGRLAVSTASNCSWQVITSAPWLTPAKTSGSGSALFNFNVAENTSTTVRTAYLEVGGRQAVITQAGRGGECGPRPLEPNQTVTGNVSTADCPLVVGTNNYGPADQYVFNGRAGQRLALETAPAPSGVYIYLFNARGELLAQSDRRLPQYAPDRLTLPADGNYTVALVGNYYAPLSYSLVLNLQPADCVYTITPERLTLPASGGTATVQLQTAAACPWQVLQLAGADWLTLEAGLSGLGARTFSLPIPANRFSYRRAATLSFGGQQFQLIQAGTDGTCATVAVTPGSALLGAFTQGDCPAQFVPQTSNDLFQQLAGDRFSFNGTAGQVFSFTVTSPSPSPLIPPGYLPPVGYALLDPQGKLLMAGQTDPNVPTPSLVLPSSGSYLFELAAVQAYQFFSYSLTLQLGVAACATNVTASTTRFEVAGGEGTLQIDAPPGCRWQVQPLTAPRQFRLEALPDGTGRGQVNFSFGPNTVSTAATAILRVGQQTIYLAQAGIGGACQTQPLPFDQFVSGQVSFNDCPLAKSWGGSFSEVPRGDRYSFAGTAGEEIALTTVRKREGATQIGDRPTLRLYDPDGQLLTDNVAARTLGGKYLLPKTGSYTLEVTVAEPYPSLAEYQLLLERLTAGCLYTTGTTFQRFDATGGNGTFNLSTNSQCRWTPRSNALWVRLTNPPGAAPFTGGVAGSFVVDNNSEPQPRLATIVAGGQTIEIEQAGSGGQCAIVPLVPNRPLNAALTANDCRPRVGNNTVADIYQLTARVNERFRVTLGNSPAPTAFNLTLLDSDWRIVTQWSPYAQPQLSFTLPPGTYYLQVAAGEVVSSVPYTLTQELLGGQCNYTVLQNNPRFFMAGGTGTLTVLAGAGCVWTATATSNYFNLNWLTITSGASGSGNGAITFQAQPFELLNSTRSGWIDVAEQRFTITQSSNKPPESCEAVGLLFAQTVSGMLTPSDCTGLFTTTGESRADRFSFTARAGQQFAVEANSGAALNLTLYDAAQRVLAQGTGNRLPVNHGEPPSYLVLPDNQTYFLEVSYPSASQTLNYTVRLGTPASCVYTLTQTTPAQNQPLPASGGNGTLQISTAPGCAWNARDNPANFPPWLTLSGAASGTGPGTLAFSAAPNDTENFRTGGVTGSATLPVFASGQLGQGGLCGARAITAGETVRGTFKPGDCANSLQKPNGLNGPPGNNSAYPPVHSFTFNATRGDQLALRLRNLTDSGGGQLLLFDPRGQLLPLNAYPPVTRLILPASGAYTLELIGYPTNAYEFVLDLTPGACGFTLESEQAQISGAGGSGTVNVLTQSECSWAAFSTDAWITLTRNSGRGNGTISFTAAPNNASENAQNRLGTIQLAGRALPIVQAGRDGSCAPQPINAGQTLAGELTPRDCVRINANNQLTAQLVDRYSFNARAGEHAQVKVVSNGALGVQIVPVSALRLNSAPVGSFQPGQPIDWFGSASLTIPADGTYVIEVMPSLNGGYLGAYTIHLEVNAPGCGVVLNQNERQFTNAAAPGSFAATAPPGCRWQVYAVNDWITINGARDRSGADNVSYALTANTGANARWGAIIAGGQIFVLEQAGTGGANGSAGTCATNVIAPGQTVFGKLSPADCHPLAPDTGLVVADRYTFSGTAGQRVQIVARMPEPALPWLRLFDANGVLQAQFMDASSLPPLHARIPSTGDFFTLPESGNYIIEIALRQYYSQQQLTQSDYALSLVSAAPACNYTVLAQPLRFDAVGGTGTLSVVTDSACPWNATVTEAWINSPAALQTGNGTVTFTVQPNPSSASRRSLLLVGGRICVIEQAGVGGSCLARPILAGQTLSGALDEQDCPGLPLPQQDRPNAFLQPYAERFVFTAQANERVLITVAANYGAANQLSSPALKLSGPAGTQLLSSSNGRLPASNDRFVLPATGTYEIELSSTQKLSYELTLLSQPNACQLGLGQRRLSFEAAGGNGAVSITTSAACPWQAVSNTPWISFDNQAKRANGTGNGTLTVTVASNPSAQARTATITAGDNLITIEQAGAGNRCAPRPLVRNQVINGKWDDGDCGGQVLPVPGVCCITRYEDRYSFNATAGERLSLTLQTAALSPRLELYDAQMQLLSAANGKRLPSGAGEFILPETGGYTLVLVESGYVGTPPAAYALLAADSNACAVTAAPNPLLAPGAGGKAALAVTASQPGCAWAARSATSWLRLPGATETQFFSGAQSLELTLAPNLGAARTGFLWLADRLVTVRQDERQLVAATEPLLCVNAATFTAGTLAPEAMVTAFGTHLALETRAGTGWEQSVADTTVLVTDRLQVERPAFVLFVSPTQVNFVLPAGLAPGTVTVAVTSADGYVTSCALPVAPVAPGLFSANASGSGLASGLVLYTKANQTQRYEPLARFDRSLNRYLAVPAVVDTPDETAYLILFGTGLRGRSDLSGINARIGTTALAVNYCGPVNSLPGLDQLNLALPASLAGSGNVQVTISIDGKTANALRFNVQ